MTQHTGKSFVRSQFSDSRRVQAELDGWIPVQLRLIPAERRARHAVAGHDRDLAAGRHPQLRVGRLDAHKPDGIPEMIDLRVHLRGGAGLEQEPFELYALSWSRLEPAHLCAFR